MTEDKIKNILNLITQATSLSAPEKQEWQGLLPLMNDKQLLEFEKILLAQNPPKQTPSQNTSPEPQALKSKVESGKGVPTVFGQTLSHIANLPKLDANSQTKPSQKQSNVSKNNQAVNNPVKSEGKFLKEIVEELELPAPKKNTPSLLAPPANTKEFFDDSQKETLSSQAKTVISTPDKHLPGLLPSSLPKIQKSSSLKPIEIPASLQDKTGSVVKAPKAPVSHGPSFPIPIPRPEKVEPIPAKNLTPLTKEPQVNTEKFEDPNHEPVKIDSIEKFSQLTLEDFRRSGKDRLKELVLGFSSQSDFFSVRFSLEKSPLFQSYLKVGKLLMETNGDFSLLNSNSTTSPKDSFTQEEFENFLDFLQETERGA